MRRGFLEQKNSSADSFRLFHNLPFLLRANPLRYGFAVGSVGVALIIQLAFAELFKVVPFFFFWPAVVLSAWLGGWGPGLVATLLSVILVHSFFLAPQSPWFFTTTNLFLLLLFALITGFISWLRTRQLHSEATILRQREELRVTLASIGDAVIVTDASGRITFLNRIAQSLTGWDTTQAVGMALDNVFRIVTHDTHEVVESPVAKVMREGTVVGLANHTILLTKDGREVPIDDSGAPIRDRSGDIIGVVLVFRDVAERYRAQEAIIHSEERYRAFIAQSSEGIWRIELEKPISTSLPPDEQIDRFYQYGFLAECNDAMAQMYGFQHSAQLIGARLGELLVRADSANMAYLRAFIESNYRLADAESHEMTKDGSSKYFLNNLVGIVENGLLMRAWGTQRDITDRKQIENHRRLLQVITAALIKPLTREEVAEVIVDKVLGGLDSSVGTIFLLSDDRQHMVMLNRKGLPDKTSQQYRQFPAGLPGPLTDAIQTEQPVWIETFEEYVTRYPQYEKNVRENGTFASACIPFHPHENTVGGLTISFGHPRRFTSADQALLLQIAQLCGQALERARLYEIEQRARLEAEEANRLKLQFLAMVSHELRTPLTSIKGFATTLLAEDVTFDAESQLDFIRIINEEADNLAELVDQLLNLTRLQSGTLSIMPQPYAPAQVVENAMPQLEVLASSHHLVIDVPSTLPEIMIDSQRIVQVLTNLVANAVRYSPPETTVRVSAKQVDTVVQFDIDDEGIGIPATDRAQVFEAFKRLERKQERQTKGAGLGLAICKGLIEAHGGQIWIGDKTTPGAVISFTLPLTT